jgi:hypothetical protein
MRTALASITLALSCITLGTLVGCYPFDSPFVKACESELKSRLRSPSGFKRISLRFEDQKDISVKDYIDNILSHDQEVDPWVKDDLESKRKIPAKFTAFIEYDAPNAYGTPVRGVAMCEYYSDDGNFTYYDRHRVIVDGKDSFEIQWEFIKKLRQNAD